MRGSRKGQRSVCGEAKDDIRVVLRCSEASNWTADAICEKRRNFHEGTSLKKIINFINNNYLMSMDNFFLKVGDKWERCVTGEIFYF
jgi:hypothetical protein